MFYIDEPKCAGCGKCIKTCQQGAIKFTNQKANINNKLCSECGMCYEICPNGAVVKVKLPEKKYQEASKNVQTKTNTGFSIGSRHTGIVTNLADMFQVIYDLFVSRVQNRASNKSGQYNQCGYHRGKGLGQKRRGRRKGRFF